MYLFFMVLIPNLLVINLFWRDHQYQHHKLFATDLKAFSAYQYQHIHSLSFKTIGAYALSMSNQYAFFD